MSYKITLELIIKTLTSLMCNFFRQLVIKEAIFGAILRFFHFLFCKYLFML